MNSQSTNNSNEISQLGQDKQIAINLNYNNVR